VEEYTDDQARQINDVEEIDLSLNKVCFYQMSFCRDWRRCFLAKKKRIFNRLDVERSKYL